MRRSGDATSPARKQLETDEPDGQTSVTRANFTIFARAVRQSRGCPRPNDCRKHGPAKITSGGVATGLGLPVNTRCPPLEADRARDFQMNHVGSGRMRRCRNLFLRILIDPGHEQLVRHRENERPHEDSDQTESDQAPNDTGKNQQQRQIGPFANQDRT